MKFRRIHNIYNKYYSIVNKQQQQYEYEIAVIGGGSGGIACAKEAGLLLGKGKTIV